MSLNKKNTNNKKFIMSIVCMLSLILLVIFLWIFKIINIYTALPLLVAIGIIFYFVFTAVYYKDSIMGGKFFEHFKNIHGED